MLQHSDSIGVFGEFGWERLGKANEGCGDASVDTAPLTPMTTTCRGFRAYIVVDSRDTSVSDFNFWIQRV